MNSENKKLGRYEPNLIEVVVFANQPIPDVESICLFEIDSQKIDKLIVNNLNAEESPMGVVDFILDLVQKQPRFLFQKRNHTFTFFCS